MPNKVQQALARYAPKVLSHVGHTVTWKENTYTAAVADPTVEADLEAGGFMLDGDFILKIPRADFNDGDGPFPAVNDQVGVDGHIYKVTSDRQKPGSAFIFIPVES